MIIGDGLQGRQVFAYPIDGYAFKQLRLRIVGPATTGIGTSTTYQTA
jgi:hypothetical protein